MIYIAAFVTDSFENFIFIFGLFVVFGFISVFHFRFTPEDKGLYRNAPYSEQVIPSFNRL